MNARLTGLAGALLLLGTGCLSTLPPVQLLTARGAYRRARSNGAGQLAPVEFQRAETALSIAEASFAVDGDEQRTRDLAYVARRKAQLASVVADSVAAKATRPAASASLHAASEATTADRAPEPEVESDP